MPSSDPTSEVRPEAQAETADLLPPQTFGLLSSRSLKTAMVSALTSALVCGSMLGAYHWMQKKSQIGVVDVASILETSELMFTEMLTKPDVSDKDRANAYDLVKQTGPKVQAAIAQIQSECNCVLLTKAAVVAGNTSDFTPQAKAILGLDTVDTQAIKARLKDSMAGRAGPSVGTPPGTPPGSAAGGLRLAPGAR